MFPSRCREEWDWLQNMDSRSACSQPEFCSAIQKAARKLFTHLGKFSFFCRLHSRLFSADVKQRVPVYLLSPES